MTSLWEIVKKKKCATLAVCGLAKNTGKTVTLNCLVEAAGQESVSIGLTSVGRDGEMWDILSYKRKPTIRVKPGTLLATSEKTLHTATARLTVLQSTGLSTPLGHVVIARAETSGNVELAGPSRIGQLVKVLTEIKNLGAQLVIVDGAFDRQSFAAPRVTDAFIMATGAILSESLAEVVRITQYHVQKIALPATSADIRKFYRPGYVVVVESGGNRAYPTSLVLEQGVGFWTLFDDEIRHVIFGGALLNPVLSNLMLSGIKLKGMKLVVRDATCLFVEDVLLDKFLKSRGHVEVLEPMQLLAVTVNPTSLESRDFPSKEFFAAITRALPGISVFDLAQGYSS